MANRPPSDSAVESASASKAASEREHWGRLGYLTFPRVIDTFPDKQRDLARLLLEMAAYADRVDSRFGTELERGQVATTYMDLAARLGWKTKKTVRHHLDRLRETWFSTFGEPLTLTSGRTEGQTATSHILIIALGQYDATQRFTGYVNDAKGTPKGLLAADNRDSREPKGTPTPPARAENHDKGTPKGTPTPGQLPVESISYSDSTLIKGTPKGTPTSGKPVDSATYEPLTEVKRKLKETERQREEKPREHTRRKEEKNKDVIGLSASVSLAADPSLSTTIKTFSPDTTEFYREALEAYSCAEARGDIDPDKRPWQLANDPEQFLPLMNRPHDWRLELLGLLLTTNDYYRGKAINAKQLKNFIEGGDLFTAETRRGYERAGIAHLLPETADEAATEWEASHPLDYPVKEASYPLDYPVKAECEVFHDRNLSRSQPHSAARSTNEVLIKKKKKITSPTAPGDKSPVNDFVSLWNSTTAGALPAAKEISRGREAKIRARLKEHPNLAWWGAVFSRLVRADFYCGREPGKGWRADIDWIIRNDTNALKFAEGEPRSREKPARSCALCNGSGKWQDASGEPESGICPKCEGRGYD